MSFGFLLIPVAVALIYHLLVEPLVYSPLSKVPGPKLYALTKWRLALDDWNGQRTRSIEKLHRKFGPVVRIGPNEVHFNSFAALRSIYGAGSSFERTAFYRIFEVYGKKNLFTFQSSRQHAERRKLLASAYSKSSVQKGLFARIVEDKVRKYVKYIDTQGANGSELFTSLHYFALDTVSHVLYGARVGATSAMSGEKSHQDLLGDILDPARRRLIWFDIHLGALTQWMYAHNGIAEQLIRPFLPMQKPVTYTGVRQHALEAWQKFKSVATSQALGATEEGTIASLLFKYHVSQKDGYLTDLEIASECADHLLAGVDTTANSLTFLIWALSQPENLKYQAKLIEEVRKLPETLTCEDCVMPVGVADQLVYVNAVIKETLRLYSPNAATQPRSSPVDTVIDGYAIPARTVVGMSAYSLHRNEQVFDKPLDFNPDRWSAQDTTVADMNKWFWPFSSGGRMCIGNNLVMTEMTTLVTAIYRQYTTSIRPGYENLTPVITWRFELFYDEKMPHMKEHECWIDFTKSAA